MKLAVIGKDVSKSTSPQIHSFIANEMGNSITYDRISIPESEFAERIDGLLSLYDGINVTIPYKLSVMPKLNKLCGDAPKIGAVNTVRTSDLTGYNTDGLGFMLMLYANGVNAEGKRVLLLGAGGAGRSVACKLTEIGARLDVYDKFSENARKIASEFGCNAVGEIPDEPYYMIINATGVGMHNSEGVSPVGRSLLSKCEAAVDLIYEPPVSEFLRIARDEGKKIINGKAMLFYQAYYAECIYFGVEASKEQAAALYEKYTGENE